MGQETEKGKAGEKPPYYGTFPGGGAPSYTHGHPAIGFPQPVPPSGSVPSAPPYYPPPPPPPHSYQAVPAYAVAEGTPVREPRLPCCGIGLGWFLFIIGFFLAAIPWYIGAFILICVRRVDYREKPGYIACTIAAILAIIVVIFGVTKGTHSW